MKLEMDLKPGDVVLLKFLVHIETTLPVSETA